jgi:hypothetical protein
MKTVHIAQSGSEYHRVKGFTFRISDHSQPSHYQSKNYFDLKTEQDIDLIIENPLFDFFANPIKNNDGFFNAIYNEKTDGFDMKQITEQEYFSLVKKMEDKKIFFLENGWKGNLAF